MGAAARPSTGALVAALVLTAFVLLVWLILLSWLTTLNDSDAAGNGMTQGFAAIGLVFEWMLLAVLMAIGALGGDMPAWAALAALPLIPASGWAALVAENELVGPPARAFNWPIAEPALVPPMVAALCIWAVMPPLRHAVPAWLAGGVVWGAVAVLTLAAFAAN